METGFTWFISEMIILQFLPFADILLLTADEMELLLDTREYQVGLFALLRGCLLYTSS